VSRVRLLPQADRDVDDAADEYVDSGGLELGLRFLAAAEATWEQLREFPLIGQECSWIDARLGGVRRTMVRSPFQVYQVFYRVDEEVEILRVLHGSRDVAGILLTGPTE